MNVTALTLTEGTVRVRAYLFFLAYFFVLTTQCVFAQTPQTPDVQVASTTPSAVVQDSYPRENLPSVDVFNDFVVGPGRFALEIAPGQSQTVEMVVSNRMGEKKRFSFGVEDMKGSEDPTQSVVLMGDSEGPYTLRDYIQIPHMEFDLEHGQRARVPVTVSLPPDAEPGGRYGTLLVSIVSNPADDSNAEGAKPSSVVVSRIGTLFFVTTPGEIEQNMELVRFGTKEDTHVFTKGPIDFDIVLENKGSVHTTPYGEVRIYNMLGEEVGFSQLAPWFVMPQSLRLREVSWDRELLMGKYTAVAKINRGYEDIVDEASVTFWVIPLHVLGAVFLVLFVFFLLLRFILSRFEFRRKEG